MTGYDVSVSVAEREAHDLSRPRKGCGLRHLPLTTKHDPFTGCPAAYAIPTCTSSRPAMLEGPYRAQSWQERWFKAEGVLAFLEMLTFLVVAVLAGYDWFLAGQYVRLLSVLGSAAAVVALTIATRLPILMFGLIVPIVLNMYWSTP